VLVGGTADRFWDSPAARSVTPHVIEIESADHGPFVAGPLSAPAAVLGRMISVVRGIP
jgi:hypothetical protein